MKTCSKCKAVKPLTEFHKGKDCKAGVRSKCKACALINQTEYRRKNPEKINEYRHKYKPQRDKWVKENPEKVKAYKDKYTKENPEKIKVYQAKYRQEKPTYSAYQVKYRKENTEKIKAKNDKYAIENREKIIIKNQLYRKRLTDGYVRDRIKYKTNIKEIPQELIELKRVQLQITRELRK